MPTFSAFPLASEYKTDANASPVGTDESRDCVIRAMSGKLSDPEGELGGCFPSCFFLSYIKRVEGVLFICWWHLR